MPVFSKISRVFEPLRRLFNFQKPGIEHLDFIDLLIDDKPVFLFAWKITNAHMIQVKSCSAKYSKKEGSAILSIDSNKESLNISVRSLWRKTNIKIQLLHTELDGITVSFLLKRISKVYNNGEIEWHTPLSKLNVHLNTLYINKTSIKIVKITPIIKKQITISNIPKPYINFKVKTNTLTFKYPN